MHVMESLDIMEMRRWTPEEIGGIVKFIRDSEGLKQDTLAARSHFSVKTLRRIEQGERVQDDTLRDLAEGLGLEKEAFTKIQKLPDFHKLAEEVKQLASKLMFVDTRPLTSWRDFEAICRVSGITVDDRSVSDELSERTAYLRDLLADWLDVTDLAQSSDMIPHYKTMMDIVTEVETGGYIPRYAVYETDDGFAVSVLVFFDKSDPAQANLTQVGVGRSYEGMARSSFT